MTKLRPIVWEKRFLQLIHGALIGKATCFPLSLPVGWDGKVMEGTKAASLHHEDSLEMRTIASCLSSWSVYLNSNMRENRPRD